MKFPNNKILHFYLPYKKKLIYYFENLTTKHSLYLVYAIMVPLTIAIISVSILFPSTTQFDIDLHPSGKWGVGQNAPEELIALTDVQFLMEKQYQKAQEEISKQVPLRFTRNYRLLEKKTTDRSKKSFSFHEMLERDIKDLRRCRRKKQKNMEIIACARKKIKRWRNLNAENWNNLLVFSSFNINKNVILLVNTIFEKFIILKEKINDPIVNNFKGSVSRLQDIKEGASGEVDIPKENMIPRQDLYKNVQVNIKLRALAKESLNKINKRQRYAFLKLAKIYLYRIDAFRFDKAKTLEAQEKSKEAISIADYTFQIKRGDTILRTGDVITENVYNILKLHQSNHWQESLNRFFSIFIQQIIFLLLLIYFIKSINDKSLQSITNILALFFSIWLFSICLFFVERLWISNYQTNEVVHFFGAWVPIGLFSILLTLSFGEKISLPVVLYLSLLSFIASKYDGFSFLLTVSVSLSALVFSKRIKKRVHFIYLSIFLAFVSMLMVSAGYLYNGYSIHNEFKVDGFFNKNYTDALYASVLGALSTISILGILPIYESIFNIPTRFKLIELADPSHPLLRRLFQRAPSTWIHTMMVSALTEKACEKLNLNSILARTGIYFHDIGKMVNAGFFIENQHLIPKLENIDKDNPALAAKVIISHVTDGIQMGKAHRLPQEVINFIPEHHGTSIMSFFYHQALQKNRRKVNKADFQYKGPKPQSKETAISMIADSVEAASRSLTRYNKESIKNLIQKIINGKIAENQFDECGLEIRELNIIKDAFLEVLISSFHSRPQYPNKTETLKLEKQRKKKKV